METCEQCGAMLLDDEIENCDGMCQDCCEEDHLEENMECDNKICPYKSDCKARKTL